LVEERGNSEDGAREREREREGQETKGNPEKPRKK